MTVHICAVPRQVQPPQALPARILQDSGVSGVDARLLVLLAAVVCATAIGLFCVWLHLGARLSLLRPPSHTAAAHARPRPHSQRLSKALDSPAPLLASGFHERQGALDTMVVTLRAF